ncbi:histone-lysine N-methyltransferase SETMAR [Trichonephila clavata]|uniref:Histone-lysine N-methyltransferase SETMAR n=1 Tax=Trichonephila clavata TaxID=2740835 RepID=A0A8X6I0L3_TRICU|nr:histone-lysine N-methyltransferase SETMAR [Trichonephila clavata]
MTIIFYDYEGIVYQHAFEPCTTVNGPYCVNVLRAMVQHVKRKRPLLRNGFLLHHDNARPHIARYVVDVLQQNNVEVLPHPPYSPDLTPCDFWLFPQLQKPLRGQNILQSTKHV